MSAEDEAIEILLKSARHAYRNSTLENSNYEFSEQDYLEVVKAIWQDRFKNELVAFKAKCSEVLVREGIDAN